MVRSKWKAAAMFTGLACAGLICAGLVYSQQAIPQGPAAGVAKPNDIVTVKENGMPPQQFMILKSYRLADGRLVQDLRNLATGEVMTVVEKTAAATSPKGQVNLVEWVKYKPDNQPMEVVQEQPVASQTTVAPADTRNKTSLVGWLKSAMGGSSAEAVQERPVQGPVTAVSESSTAAPAATSSKSSLLSWIRGTPAAPPVEVVQQQSMPLPPSQGDKMQQVITEMPAAAPAVAAKMPRGPAQGDVAKMPTPSTPTVAVKYRTVEEPGKPALKCRVSNEWFTAKGQKVCQLQAVETGEILTIVEMPASGHAGDSSDKVTATLYHWGRSTTPPAGVPVPPETVVQAQAMPVGRIANSSFTTPAAMPNPVVAAQPLPASPSCSCSETVVMPAPASLGVKGDSQKSLVGAISSLFSNNTNVAAQPSPGSPSCSCSETVVMPPPAGLAVQSDSQKSLLGAVGSLLSNQNSTSDPTRAADAARTAKMLEMPTVSSKLPPSPPDNYMRQGTEPDSKATTAKAAADAPPAPGSISWIPPAPPKVSSESGDVATPSAPTPEITQPSLPQPTSMPGSQMGSKTKSDPLLSPEVFATTRSEDRAQALKDIAKAPAASTAQAGAAGVAVATDTPRFPLGTASVVAAANGGDLHYLPVPMVTVPQARPPVPPAAQLPKPPEAPDPLMYTNAFTPPQSPEEMQYAAAMQQRQMMPMPISGPMGYQGPMPPNPMTMAQGYPMPQGYGMPIMPQGYPMPMMPSMPVQPVTAYANPAMDRPGLAASGEMSLQQCVSTLQNSIFPTQRETAVIQLCNCDWRMNPQIVQLVLTTAKDDPAGMVRVAAIMSLSRMGAATEAVTTTLHQLKTDADPRVRLEAEQALKALQK